MGPARRWLLALGAAACGTLSVLAFATGSGGQVSGELSGGEGSPALAQHGRDLFQEGCASCHGEDARGIPGRAPSLYGAGAASADFYLSTGRMPLDSPGDQPLRSQPRYPDNEIDALVAYVGSLGGPAIPDVNVMRGRLNKGFAAFSDHCAGCHQAVAKGGVVTGAFAPALDEATPTQVGEAVRVGPYVMPKFGHQQIDHRTLDSIARYVEETKNPDDRGGFGIGNIGPVPEGMVAWLLAIAAMLLVARFIGERER
jgi:ubiquinol-cytochrome c reductase cytochrome c subunit